jgi:plasmid maintenance system antidote protein VapI
MTGKQLKKALDSAGISQRRMAKLLEIHERSMRRFSAGVSPIPKTVELAVRYLCEHPPEVES